MSDVDSYVLAAELRKPRLEQRGWRCETPGADGLGLWLHPTSGLSLIHSIAREDDGRAWAHVSVASKTRRLPLWEQVRDAWWCVYPDRAGIIVVAPETEHYSLAEVMHVFGCLEGERVIPNFARGGML